MDPDYAAVLKAILPAELFSYFDLIKVDSAHDALYIYFDEKNIIPKSYKDDNLLSKGFHDSVTTQDFPIRGKAVYYRVRRRKWKNQDTGKVVSNKWDITSEGTNYTNEFASFLKDILKR